MPDGDTILDVDNHVLAEAGCRLPTSQPALDVYDQILVEASALGTQEFPDPSPQNDGHPGTPELIYPLNQALEVPTTVTLEWPRADETDCYEIRFGTSDPPPLLPGCISENQLEVSDLDANTTYYWQVWAKNTCPSSTGSDVRSFTTGS